MRELSCILRLAWAAVFPAALALAGCGTAGGGGGGYALLIGAPCTAAGTSQCSLRPGGGSAVASCDGATWQETAACSAAQWCAVVGGAPPQCVATAAGGDAGHSAAADSGGGASGKDAGSGQDLSAQDGGAVSAKDTAVPKDAQQDSPILPDSQDPPDTADQPDQIAPPDTPAQDSAPQDSAPADSAPPDAIGPIFAMPKFSLVDVNPGSPTYKQAVSLQMFAGKRIIVLAGAGWCPSCVAQNKGMEKIRAQLAASGRDDFAMLTINDVSAASASNQKAITTSVKVHVVQSTSAVNGWKIMGAQKNDGFFFDYDGKKRGIFQGAGTIYTNIWEEWIVKSLGQQGVPTTGYTCKNGGAPGKWASVCAENGL